MKVNTLYTVVITFTIVSSTVLFIFYFSWTNYDSGNYDKIDDIAILRRVELENSKRKQQVDEICRKNNLHLLENPSHFKQPPVPQYEVFYYDTNRRISWCPIYKAGSSTWLYNFALLGGYTEFELESSKIQLSQLVRTLYPELEANTAEKVLEDSLKFLVVRHPFERILSAYRDKLENVQVRGIDGTEHFYRSYGLKIVSKYRKGGTRTNIRSILKDGQYKWNPNQSEPIGTEPSFKEFVQYLIDSNLETADDHWIPYYLFCTPCSVHYDVICKVETMLQDQLYVIHKADLQNKLKPNWRHMNGKESVKNEISKIYFSQLDTKMIKKLYEKFKFDFLLFNYGIEKYNKYVKELCHFLYKFLS